jgi:hypothetical protein
MRLCIFTACVDATLFSQATGGLVHGDGLTALQFRETAGDITRSFRFPVVAPTRIKLERQGPLFTLWTGGEGKPLPDGTPVEFMQPRDPAKTGTPVPSR